MDGGQMACGMSRMSRTSIEYRWLRTQAHLMFTKRRSVSVSVSLKSPIDV